MTEHFNLGNSGRIREKRAFHPYSVGSDASYGESCVRAAAPDTDYRSAEDLCALPFSFDDAVVYPYDVTRAQSWDVGIRFDALQGAH
jgi:hypothetical protein